MLKTYSMYLRAAKTEAESAGVETEGMADSVSKLRDEIKSLTGVDIMIDDKTFKSSYEITKEIAKVWDSLSDVTQANVLERLAGKRQGNVLASLITNFNVAEEAMKTSLDSAGSAAKENEEFLESIEGHIQNLTIAFEELSETVLKSDFIKTTIDFLTNLVELLNDVTKIFNVFSPNGTGGMAALIGVATEVFSSDGTGGIGKGVVENLIKKWRAYRELEKVLKDLPDEIAKSENLSEAIDNASKYYDRKYKIDDNSTKEERKARDDAIANHEYEAVLASKSSIIHQKAAAQSLTGFLNINKKVQDSIKLDKEALTAFAKMLNETLGEDGRKDVEKLNTALNGAASPLNNASQAAKEWAVNLTTIEPKEYGNMIDSFTKKQEENAKAATLGAKAQRSFRNAVTSIFGTLTSIGMSLAINAVISGISLLIQRTEEEMKAARESAEQLKEEQKPIQDYAAKISLLRSELEENNTTQERAVEIRKELYEIQNDLIDNYGVERDEINLVTGDLETQLQTLREINKEKYNEAYELHSGSYRNAVSQMQDQHLTLDNRSGWLSNDKGFMTIWGLKEIFESSGFRTSGSNAGWFLDGDIYTLDKALKDVQEKIQGEINGNNLTKILRDDYQKVYDYLSEVRRDWSSKIIEENEGIYSEWLQNESDYSDDYWDLIRERAKVDYAIKENDAEEIAKANQSFKEAFDEAIKVATSAGDTDVVHYLNEEFEEIIKNLNEKSLKEDLEITLYPTVTADIDSLETKLSETKKQIEDVFKNANLFDKAIEAVSKGESISFDDVQSMVGVDDSLAGAFIKNADGYTIAVDRLVEARQKYTKATEDSLGADIEASRTLIKTANENISSMQRQSSALEAAAKYDSGAAKKKSELDAKIQEETANIDRANGVINQNNLLLGEIEDSVESVTDNVSDVSTAIEKAASRNKTLSAALEDISETGHISAATYAEIVTNGGNLAECLEIQNGQLVVNVDKLKQLEGQEYKNAISANNLAIAELQLSAARKASVGEDYSGISKQITTLEAENSVYMELLDELKKGDWGGSDSSSDPWKEEFETLYAEKQHLRELDELSDEDFYEWLAWANEYYFSDTNKYLEENRKYKEELYNWEKQQEEDRHNQVISDLTEEAEALLDKKDYEGAIGKYDSAIAENNKRIKGYRDLPNGEEIFVDEIKELEDNKKSLTEKRDEAFVDRLTFDADELKDKLGRGLIFWQDYADGITKIFNDADGKLDNDWLKEYLDPDKEYDTRIAEWKKINDYDEENLEQRKALAEYMARLNDEIYGADNPNRHSENQKDIDDFNEDTRVKATDEEIRYWETLKTEVEEYYQAQIESLEKVQDETDKLARKEELLLNLTKARTALENAKKNKSQLVFSNGAFYYDIDQEAAISAQEEYDKALKDIEDNARQEEIDLLTEQKEQSATYYDTIIELLEKFRDKIIPATEDSEVLADAYQYERQTQNMDPEKVDQAIAETTNKSSGEKTPKSDFFKKIKNNEQVSMNDVMAAFDFLMSSVLPSQMMPVLTQDVVNDASQAINNVYSNSNISNDNSVSIGTITITTSGNTSQEILTDICDQLAGAIQERMQRFI